MTSNSTAFHRLPRDFSASFVNDTLASALTDYKQSHDLTDLQLGLRIGRTADRAQQYRTGQAKMSVATLVQATAQIGPELANAAFLVAGYRLVPTDAGAIDALPLSAVLHGLIAALADGVVTADEVAGMSRQIEAAQGVLDALRAVR